MNIGDLRYRVVLQRPVLARDSFGSGTEQWEDAAAVWAAIYPLSGREYFAAQQVNAEVSTKIVLRYRQGVQPNMRVKYGDRIFEILSVIDMNERKKELQLMCKEMI